MAEMMPQNNTLQMLLNTFTGKKETTNRSSGVSSTGMAEMLKSILGSTQGLAQVSSGEKIAGLYNTSTRSLLTNDLLTRSAAEVSKAGTGETTTRKVDPQLDPGKSLLTALGLSAGKNLLGPTVEGVIKKSGAGDIGKQIADYLGVGAESSIAGNLGSDFFGSAAGDFSSGALSEGLGSLAASVGTQFASDIGVSLLEGVGSSLAESVASDVGSSVGGDVLAGILGGFKDGGKVKKGGMANGGRVRRLSRGDGGMPASGPESTAVASDAVSEGVAAPGSSVSIGALGQAAMGIASANPIGVALGAINAAVSVATGKSVLANIIDIISGSADTGLDGTVGSSGIGLDASANDANNGDTAVGVSAGNAPGDAAPAGGWNDGGKLPRQPGDPKGIKDTIPAKIGGKKGPNLSGGEFIVPTDVVETLGEDFFNRIVDAYHVPAAVQGAR